MSDPQVAREPDLKTLNSLWLGYTLTPEKMEVRLEINGKEKKLVDSPWDNDSMIIADHCLGSVVGLFSKKDAIIAKLKEAIDSCRRYKPKHEADNWIRDRLAIALKEVKQMEREE